MSEGIVGTILTQQGINEVDKLPNGMQGYVIKMIIQKPVTDVIGEYLGNIGATGTNNILTSQEFGSLTLIVNMELQNLGIVPKEGITAAERVVQKYLDSKHYSVLGFVDEIVREEEEPVVERTLSLI
ncbi:MAG: hypothetical protein AABX00_02340 [Nanoarchaeota archaeon]